MFNKNIMYKNFKNIKQKQMTVSHIKIVFIVLFFALSQMCKAQYQFINYTSYNETNAIATQADTVWIGTRGGVCKRLNNGFLLEYYTVQDGLANNYVLSIAIDAEGNKWFGTYGGGVSKFDGTNWTSYTTADGLVNNYVRAIVIDSEGNKWFGTNLGVSKFDNTSWITYTTANGLVSNYVLSIAIDSEENIWFGTYGGGVSKFDGTNWVGYTTADGLINNYVLSVAIDSEGNKWFGTNVGGISKFDGTNWTSYTTGGLENNDVKTIAIDSEGNKWFGTYGGGVSKFDDTNWTSYTTADGLSNNNILAIVIDTEGNKWFGTYGGGVSKFDGSNWTSYTTTDWLVSNNVHSIAIDAEGNKWFGTIGGGISKFDSINWTSYTTANGLVGDNVLSIAIDTERNKWFGTNGGVSKFDGTNWTSYTTANGLVYDYVQSIAIDTLGNKWFGTTIGVSKFDGTNWTSYTTANGLVDGYIYAIAIDAEGNKWFGTSGGVSKFDGTNWTNYTTADGLVNNIVRAIAIDAEGNKWFATWGGGVSKFDGTHWTSYTTTDGLASNYVLAVAVDAEGNKWFGTYGGGVSKFDGTNWISYSTADGLADNIVGAITTDPEGNKWFGTYSGGVSKLSCENALADFSFSDNLCGAKTVVFTNQSSKTDIFTKYEWDINNDEAIDYTTQDIQHYFDIGTYSVKLTVYNGTCQASKSANISINPNPVSNITGVNTICSGLETTYGTNYYSGHSYSWSIEGGSILSGQSSHEVYVGWGSSGYGKIILTETIDSTSCYATKSYDISIYPSPEKHDITGENTVCINSQFSYMIDESPNYLSWQTSGGTIDNPSQRQIKINWTQAGTHEIICTETNDYGCSVENILTVNVQDKELLDVPEIFVKFNAILVASNLHDAFTGYQWYNSLGKIENATRQFYEPPWPLSGEYYIVATDKNGCKAESKHFKFNEKKLFENIVMYPNPANNELFIGFNQNMTGKYLLDIYNNSGQKMASYFLSDMQNVQRINTSGLKTGIYFINIYDNEQIIYRGKVLVRH
jgi:ligand-binding sensor domain-containing protein